MKKLVIVAAVFLALAISSPSLRAEPIITTGMIVEGASTALLLNSIRNLINEAIDKAQNTGSYLLFKSGTELKSVIDTWEKANTNLLGKAFRELNDSQRKFFSDANASAQKLNQDVSAQVEAARIIAELANQTVADVGIFDGRLALFRYAPRIAYPGMNEQVSFTIRGINFDKADPQITLPNGELAPRVSLSKQEAIFSVPTSVFSFKPSMTEFAKLKLSYLNPSDGLFGSIEDFFKGRTKRETTDIAVLQLPQKLGDFSLQTKTRDTVRDAWNGGREFYWSGRNDSRTETQGPHDNGWRIIISSVHQVREWGEAGRGCHLTSNNEHGIAIEIRVGVIRTLTNPNAPGYQHCVWNWQEYLDRQVINDQPPISGEITWSKDIPLTLPENKESLLLRVKLWGGIERALTGSQTEPFYRVVEAGNSLVIQPQIPADLNGL